MKIVHCIFSMATGGAQVLTVELLNCFSDEHEMSLIIVNNEWDESILAKLDKRVSVYRIGRNKGSRNLFHIYKLNFLLWKLSPDIVHCHEPNMTSLFLRKPFKTILTIHDIGKVVKNHSSYDLVVAISQAVSTDFEQRYNVQPEVVANGIDMASYSRRKNYSIASEKSFKIIQLSRLIHEKKGQDLLIRSINEIKRVYVNRRIELFIVGDGSSKDFLIDLVRKLGLQDQVHIMGSKSREWIVANLFSFDLLVQPSLYEGFGLTLLEGFASGIPVIASNIDGPAEILNNLSYDFKFVVNDVASCSEKILEIIRLYECGHIASIMQDSIGIIIDKYNIDRIHEGYSKAYQ